MKQVEFYFSDGNLPTDAFLLKQVSKSPEGWGALRPALLCHVSCISADKALDKHLSNIDLSCNVLITPSLRFCLAAGHHL